jgi:hypothetical protein
MTGCGHTRHVGTCPACQRTQLARWHAQLTEAIDRADVSRAGPRASHLQWNHAALIADHRPPNPAMP